MSEDLAPRIAFWALATLVLGGAVVTITRRNAVTAVMALVGTFFGLAALYAMLASHFLAAIQVLVYAGAIMTLFVFVVMLLNRDEYELLPRRGILARAVGTALAAGGMIWVGSLLVRSAGPDSHFHTDAPPEGWGGVASVGDRLFNDYLFPFEAISFLLLVAVIGAIVVARIPRKRAPVDPSEAETHAPVDVAPTPGAHQ